ncbi:hypothetical protein [Nonomuraea sp. CA-141351]|uniref:hypothetical protein n=1 Tax=Nonomuraea sp. CA-141351 TaxID=3239996 RepID=UPI003D948DC9
MKRPPITTAEEFVQALAEGGMPFADDDARYCPAHGWECDHQDKCSPDECELEGDCCR